MKVKRVLILTLSVFVFGILFAVFIFHNTPAVQLNPTEINDVVKTLSDNWEDVLEEAELPELQYKLDYVILDKVGNLIAVTRNGLNENINSAIRHRDTIVDIEKDGETLGKVIFYNDTAETWESYKISLITAYAGVLGLLAVIYTGYAVYLNHAIFRPFNRLKKFAGNIAAGNLDVPLEMDRDNLFGAFTESFDIMREELDKARENERNANQSKKELVASLSHDIKTPVASIKAVSELMLVTADNEKDVARLKTIEMKTGQIEILVNNMFHATLEELQELNVSAIEVPSTVISGLIKNADYEHRAKPYSIPDCIILADVLRLQQVIDNIISNSYKYAGTSIEINSYFEESRLVLEIFDFGAGVSDNELPLIFNKYYRGENAAGKNGYGLGLYISRYLIEQMSGELQCENRTDGITFRLMLRLAG